MATSSEDVLMCVNHVRHKKSDGVLYVMAERIAWIMNGKDTFSISHKYADIKLQKISPEGKPKIQLQVLLYAGDSSTFHFTNPEGTAKQIEERDSVKEYLQQLLPKFKRKVNKELEEKNKLLAEDPELFQLYRDLVTSQVITAEEFWATHMPQGEQGIQLLPNQMTGVSGAFLADIKPQTDGCNGLKYNLTADVIDSIFKTYPAVKKKHMSHVPDKLSESEFWTRFFQSHYFHRDRINPGGKDLFAECVKSDEQDISSEIARLEDNSLVNLSAFKDITSIEDYGAAEEPTQPQNHAINQNMIRRFNHHSMMVLKSCESNTETSPQSATEPQTIPEKKIESIAINGVKKRSAPLDEPDSSPQKKTVKIQSKVVFEDLEEKNDTVVSNLKLSRADRYLHGPTPVTSVEYVTNDELVTTVHSLHEEMGSWKPNLPNVLNNNTAVAVLGELSPGGALMMGARTNNLYQTIPQHVQQELKNLYSALCELLRHFWSCFPVTTEALEDKVTRMRANLERFQYAKLMPFQDALLRDHLNTNLVDHLNEIIEAAFQKYNNWQMRKYNVRKLLQ